jgi:hypothetical protein
LYQRYHWPDDETVQKNEDRRTAGLAGLAVVLLILIGSLLLVQQLRTASRVQDCLMAGRRNCDALVAG